MYLFFVSVLIISPKSIFRSNFTGDKLSSACFAIIFFRVVVNLSELFEMISIPFYRSFQTFFNFDFRLESKQFDYISVSADPKCICLTLSPRSESGAIENIFLSFNV